MKIKIAKKIGKKLQDYRAVVITGGSSGIGKATMEIIAKISPQIPICCVSRSNPEQLDCEKFLYVKCDLSNSEDIKLSVPKILNFLSDAKKKNNKPALLINNAGFGLYGTFESNNVEKIGSLIDVNVRALTVLSRELIGEVGRIINISSTAAWQPCPYLAVYAASKSYVLSFSLALDYEMKKSGKEGCLCICPGPTSSNFFKTAGWDNPPLPSGFGHTSEDVGESILLALSSGKTLKIIGFVNSLQSKLEKIIPILLLTRLSGWILSKVRVQK